MIKNVGESTIEEVNLENGFYILHFQNESAEKQTFERTINSTFIQLHFCLRGNSKFFLIIAIILLMFWIIVLFYCTIRKEHCR